jgi:hypothetical protein
VKAWLLVATAVGIAAGIYAGTHLLIPLVPTALLWWAGRRLLPDRPADFVGAAAVQLGHMLWIGVGLIVIGRLTVDLADIAILLVGSLWLLVRPGLAPVVTLTVYQGAALLLNLAAFLAMPVGHNLHRALLIHLIWRVLALILMWRGYRRARAADEHAAGPRAY